MGKNAKRRKEAKLQEKLKRTGSGHEHCHHEGCGHHHPSAGFQSAALFDGSKASVETSAPDNSKLLRVENPRSETSTER